jgi:hypothetical protein
MVEVSETNGTAPVEVYAYTAVDLDTASSPYIIVYSADPLEGVRVSVGSNPNTNEDVYINVAYRATTGTWTVVTNKVDETDGLTQSGWILWERTPSAPFDTTLGLLYAYQLRVVGTLTEDTLISVYTMPYFDISDFGLKGQCSGAWKNRAVYSFEQYPEYLYISATDLPDVLTGSDSAVLEMGDGRPHKIVAIKPFFNNLLVFQEEVGEIGGCITLVQGYLPENFGRVVLSTRVGTMSAKTVDVVENVLISTATDEKLKTVAYFLSRYGVAYCDGTGVGFVSDSIQNYFDPAETSTCIRFGYENQMWLKYDPIVGVIRVGLVCGTSATVPNVFPIYDLVDHCWYFDVYATAISCFVNISRGATADYNVPSSVTVQGPIIQLAGGVNDGSVYMMNTGTADTTIAATPVITAIDSYITAEFGGLGNYLDLLQFEVQCKAQSGDLLIYISANNILLHTITTSMAAEVTNQTIKRILYSLNVVDQHISIKLDHSSATTSVSLYTVGMEAKLWRNR